MMRALVISFCWAAFAITSAPVSAALNASISTVFQFGKGTWVENIAIRANGNLVVVIYDRPEVYELNPFNSTSAPKLVYRFENATRVTGIAEPSPDNFIVVVVSKGGFALWNLDLNSAQTKATQLIQHVPNAGSLNGLAALSPEVAFASDTMAGVVYRFNLKTGAADRVLQDPTMNTVPGILGGINGLRRNDKHLYYTNTISGVLARIPIDGTSGSGTGPAEVISKNLFGADDFAIGGSEDEIFVMNWLMSKVLKVNSKGSVETVPDTSKLISWPTSAQFGRAKGDERTLYVTSSGNPLNLVLAAGRSGPLFDGGKVCAIKLT